MRRLAKRCLMGTVAMLWACAPVDGPARAADSQVQETPDRSFRLEWSKEGQKLSGYVYNLTSRYAAKMRLRVDGVAASGNIVTTERTWVRDVPPNNRSFFEVKVADAPAYRITVESYTWIQEIASSSDRWRAR